MLDGNVCVTEWRSKAPGRLIYILWVNWRSMPPDTSYTCYKGLGHDLIKRVPRPLVLKTRLQTSYTSDRKQCHLRNHCRRPCVKVVDLDPRTIWRFSVNRDNNNIINFVCLKEYQIVSGKQSKTHTFFCVLLTFCCWKSIFVSIRGKGLDILVNDKWLNKYVVIKKDVLLTMGILRFSGKIYGDGCIEL